MDTEKMEGRTFHTTKGMEFGIEVKGNELFVDRRGKSLTSASVNMAYKKWSSDKGCGPKALGVFGASYLWAVFREVDGRDAGRKE